MSDVLQPESAAVRADNDTQPIDLDDPQHD